MGRRGHKRIQMYAYAYLQDKGPQITANITAWINNDIYTNPAKVSWIATKKTHASVTPNQLGAIMRMSPLFRHALDENGQELPMVKKKNAAGGQDRAWLWEARSLDEVRDITKDKPYTIARLPHKFRVALGGE